MTAPQMGWLDRIVAVNWGGGWYVLLQALINVNSDQPNPNIVSNVLAKNVKKVFELKKVYTAEPASDQTINVVYLPIQNMPFPTNPQDQFIPCHGHFTYFDTAMQEIGLADADEGYLHGNLDNHILGGWWNSPARPTASLSAFTSPTADIVGSGGPFASFTVGKQFTDSEAAAWAAALSGTYPGPGSGGYPIGLIPTVPEGFPSPCDDITGEAPKYPDWYPNWTVGTHTIHNPAQKFLEYSALFEVSGSVPAAGEKIVQVLKSGGSGWNTFVKSYKKANEELAEEQTGNSPYPTVNDPSMVWWPITPFDQPAGEADVDDTSTVQLDKDGDLTTF